MIAVIDYGSGNLRSVTKALEKVGAEVRIVQEPALLEGAHKMVLPGVGAFGDAVNELTARGLFEPVRQLLARGVPYLGICLGMQLLFEESEEVAGTQGFAYFPGTVRRFPSGALKVPHMGWNEVALRDTACPLFEGIENKSQFYFCHSYFCAPQDSSVAAGVTEYGAAFTSFVWQQHIYGLQFHPEKSQKYGLSVLGNFVNLC